MTEEPPRPAIGTPYRQYTDWQEEQIRKNRDSIKEIKNDLNRLYTDLDDAFKEIGTSLDRLGAPPSKEESPALAEILKRLDAVEEAIDTLFNTRPKPSA